MPYPTNRPVDWIDEFVRRHEHHVYRTALAVMGSKADAEDVLQDVFLKVIEKAPLFESTDHETAWLVRVTVNQCRSRLRSPWRKKTEPLLDSYPAQDQTQHTLMDIILTLPSKYRIVIYLFYYEGYSTKEIAALTGQKDATVRSHLTRARQKLKVILEGEIL